MSEWLKRLPEDSALVVGALAVLLLLLVLSRLVGRSIDGLEDKGHLQPTMAKRLQVARRWALALLGPLMLLQATGLAQHAWAVISTVTAAVAIGFFAAWSLLSNTTSALLLVTFRPFRLGDRVQLVEHTTGFAITGKVVDMSLMFTTLESVDQDNKGGHLLTRIPNSMFFQKIVRVQVPGPVEEDLPFFAEEE